jgi:hypothetical protein
MVNQDVILEYLNNNPQKAYCDDCLSERLYIKPRQQVNQICRKLAQEKRIHRNKSECSSCANYKLVNSNNVVASKTSLPKIKEEKDITAKGKQGMRWKDFEHFARQTMSKFYRVQLAERKLPDIPKRFDMVSSDGTIVGDAQFLSLVRGENLPPAKYMEISGHVWLLEHVSAKKRFLVFGNQREVPEGWLKKYGEIVKGIEFYFLHETGELARLD